MIFHQDPQVIPASRSSQLQVPLPGRLFPGLFAWLAKSHQSCLSSMSFFHKTLCPPYSYQASVPRLLTMLFILFVFSSQPWSLFESSWLLMSTCVYLFSLLEWKHHEARSSSCFVSFLKFLQSLIPAWSHTEALKTSEGINALPEGFTAR